MNLLDDVVPDDDPPQLVDEKPDDAEEQVEEVPQLVNKLAVYTALPYQSSKTLQAAATEHIDPIKIDRQPSLSALKGTIRAVRVEVCSCSKLQR